MAQSTPLETVELKDLRGEVKASDRDVRASAERGVDKHVLRSVFLFVFLRQTWAPVRGR